MKPTSTRNHASAKPTALLTIAELAKELRLTTRGVQTLTASGKIPVMRISRRCTRYHLPRVLDALSRLEKIEVGRPRLK